MQYLKEKLNSQSGVTILFALLAFTVATMVSLTIVTAANSMVRRVQNDRKEERTRLALSSAANLVKEEISKTSYMIEEVDDHHNEVDKEGTLQEEVKRAVDNLLLRQMASDYIYEENDSFTIDADNIEENVIVSFQMNGQYDAVFQLRIEESGETMYVTATGKKEMKDGVDTGKILFTWEGKQITELMPEECVWSKE